MLLSCSINWEKGIIYFICFFNQILFDFCNLWPVCLLLLSSAGPDWESRGYLPSENPYGFKIYSLIETHLLLLQAATQQFLSALCSIVPPSEDSFFFFLDPWIPTWLMSDGGDGGDLRPGLLRWLLSILLHFSHNEVSAGLSSDCQQLSAGERSLMSGPRSLLSWCSRAEAAADGENQSIHYTLIWSFSVRPGVNNIVTREGESSVMCCTTMRNCLTLLPLVLLHYRRIFRTYFQSSWKSCCNLLNFTDSPTKAGLPWQSFTK